jgi:hypothetical protein
VILEKENGKYKSRYVSGCWMVKRRYLALSYQTGVQKVFINGFISDNPADVLKLSFEKFNMRTLNQLTRTSGIFLKGYLMAMLK